MKAKKKRTRLWSILLALVMVVGMLPTVALAAESQTADFTAGDGSAALALLNAAKTGTEDSTWDSSNNTLTLNGVNFTTTAAIAVKLPKGAKIVLAAGTTNTITGGDLAIGVSYWVECYGVYAEDGLTIEGTGKLTVTGGNATGSHENAISYGIYAKSGEVSITGGTVEANGGTVTVTGNQTTISCGIGASENVTISSGVVTAIGGTVTSTDGNATGISHGIFSKNVSISSPAIVIAKGGTTNNQSYGIYAVEGVTISGAVEATGDTVSSLYGTSCGIGASKNVTISGTAVVSAKGGNATGVSGNSNGIYANENVTISGGTVSATGGTASSGNSYGIFAFQNVSIQDTADVTVYVTATGGEATNGNSYGIFTNYGVIIESGTVTATGDTATKDSYGIRASTGLTISGDNTVVTATGGTASRSKGIFVNSNYVTILSGKVKATGGKATNDISFGIDSSFMAIRGGTVTAKGGEATSANGYSYGISSLYDIEIYDGTVTAEGGKATNGSYGIDSERNTYISGGTVTAKAGTANTAGALSKKPKALPAAYQWRISESDEYTQFSDYASAYTWSAADTYVEIRDTDPAAATTYTVTVTNGTASVGTASVSQAAAGTKVTLTATAAPSGQVFDKWVVESGNVTLADATSATTTFTMPAGDVSVKATYKNAPTTGNVSGYIPPVQKPIVKNDDNETTSADLKDTTSTSGGKTTANVDKAIGQEIVDKAVANESKEIVIDANAKNASAAAATVIAQISIPRDTLAAIAEKTEADVTVKNDVAEIKLDNSAAGAVAEQAAGDTIQVIVEKVAEKENKVEFQLKVVCSAGNVIRDFQGGNVAVTVAIPKEMADKKVVCIYIDDNGKMSKVKGQKNEDGTYTFTTGHFSTYVLMPEEEADAAIAAQQKEETLAKLDSYELVARSAAGKTSGGKKAIKIRVYDKNGLSTDFFDGIEIYRSTKKNSGYGKKPVFVIKSGKSSYYNTAIKSGTRYYYKVRGFVMIDGQKYYTDYSLKAIRTAK
ncbi:MAG: hypothetical protein ACI4LJ_09555 [Anaerovoracaceae bacterium]